MYLRAERLAKAGTLSWALKNEKEDQFGFSVMSKVVGGAM